MAAGIITALVTMLIHSSINNSVIPAALVLITVLLPYT